MENEVNNEALNNAESTATTESPIVENKTADDGFLSGFSDEALPDEGAEIESNTKEEQEEAKEINNNNEEVEKRARADKRTRANERISRLLAENKAKEAELAELRRSLERYQTPSLVRDEDGNVSAEDFARYNEELIDQKLKEQQAIAESKIAEVEKQRDLDNSIAKLQAGIAERTAKYDFLNTKSEKYNPDIEALVSGVVLSQVRTLQDSGITDYGAMADMALSVLDDQLALIALAENRGKSIASDSLRRMQNGGALSPSQNGNPSADDGFLAGFFG